MCDIVLISRDPELIRLLRGRYGAAIHVTQTWPRHAPRDLLIVDSAGLSPAVVEKLIPFSRVFPSCTVVMLGNQNTDRGVLTRVSGDAYIDWPVPCGDILTNVESCSGQARFRSAGRELARLLDVPEKLARFIAALFGAHPPFRHVSAAARAVHVPERTLRHQWRRVAGTEIRLHDLMVLVRRLRTVQPKQRQHTWDMLLAFCRRLPQEIADEVLERLAECLRVSDP